MNYYFLRQEIDTDPLARGYSTMSNQEIVDSLNTVNRTRNVEVMTGSEVLQNVDSTEYAGLTDGQKQAFWGLLGIGSLNPWGIESAIMIEIFGSGSATLSALSAARVESISRATELGFPFLYVADIDKALGV